MKRLIGFKGSRAVRLAGSALAVAAATAAAIGIVAAQGYAAHSNQFNAPTLENGLLTVEGTNESDAIALRLQAGQPSVLQVDVGDNGSADFSFQRDRDRQDPRHGRQRRRLRAHRRNERRFQRHHPDDDRRRKRKRQTRWWHRSRDAERRQR